MVGTKEQCIEWLSNQEPNKTYRVKEYREHRSLNANAYAWLLIGKIADAMQPPLPKETVYLEMLKSYGQSEIISVLAHIDLEGYFKYYEPIAKVRLQGKDFIHYKLFKGSSQYNTREMSILIDGIVSEAKQMGIETMPDFELERLKSMWRS